MNNLSIKTTKNHVSKTISFAIAFAGASIAATGAALATPPAAGSAGSVDTWLQATINLLSGLVGIVIVISIIVAGIQYMTAGSNASQVSAAKQRISMAVLSFILFAFAYAILQWIVPGGIF